MNDKKELTFSDAIVPNGCEPLHHVPEVTRPDHAKPPSRQERILASAICSAFDDQSFATQRSQNALLDLFMSERRKKKVAINDASRQQHTGAADDLAVADALAAALSAPPEQRTMSTMLQTPPPAMLIPD